MPLESHHVDWLQAQWRRYRRLLLIAVAAVWLLCSAGILLATDAQFPERMALLAMLLVSTVFGGRLLWVIRGELRALEAQAAAGQVGPVEKRASRRRTPRR